MKKLLILFVFITIYSNFLFSQDNSQWLIITSTIDIYEQTLSDFLGSSGNEGDYSSGERTKWENDAHDLGCMPHKRGKINFQLILDQNYGGYIHEIEDVNISIEIYNINTQSVLYSQYDSFSFNGAAYEVDINLNIMNVENLYFKMKITTLNNDGGNSDIILLIDVPLCGV